MMHKDVIKDITKAGGKKKKKQVLTWRRLFTLSKVVAEKKIWSGLIPSAKKKKAVRMEDSERSDVH